MKLSEYIKKYGDKKVDVEKLDKFIIDDKVWIPEEGDLMYYLDMFGEVDYDYYYLGDPETLKIIEFQKVFKTRVEAEFEIEKRKFLLFMGREFIRNSDEMDWEDENQDKYFIYFNCNNSLIEIEGNFVWQRSTLYTTNRKWLKEFIKEHKEEIKKYYFEIQEEKIYA